MGILGPPVQGKNSNDQACCWEGEHHSPSRFGFLNLAHAEPGPINIPGCHQASSRTPHGPQAWARHQVGAGSLKMQAEQGPGLPCRPLYHWVLTGPGLAEWGQTNPAAQTHMYASMRMHASTFPHAHQHRSHNSQLFHPSKYRIKAATAVFPHAPTSCSPFLATGIWGKTAAKLPGICGGQSSPSVLPAAPLYLRAP